MLVNEIYYGCKLSDTKVYGEFIFEGRKDEGCKIFLGKKINGKNDIIFYLKVI